MGEGKGELAEGWGLDVSEMVPIQAMCNQLNVVRLHAQAEDSRTIECTLAKHVVRSAARDVARKVVSIMDLSSSVFCQSGHDRRLRHRRYEQLI